MRGQQQSGRSRTSEDSTGQVLRVNTDDKGERIYQMAFGNDEDEKSNSKTVIIVVIVILLLAGAAAWYFVCLVLTDILCLRGNKFKTN